MMPKSFKNLNLKLKNIIKIFSTYVFTLVFLIMSLKAVSFSMSKAREDETREKIKKILDTKEFSNSNDKSAFDDIAKGINDLVDKIKQFFNDIFKRVEPPKSSTKLPDSPPMHDSFYDFFRILIIILVIALIIAIIYFVSRFFNKNKNIKKMQDTEILISLKDCEEIFQNAIDCGNRGDLRQGIRYLYIALLLNFNHHNIIKIDKSKTNRQYADEIRNSGFKLYPMVRDFTNDFNTFWYGNRTPSPERFEYWKENLELIIKEAENENS